MRWRPAALSAFGVGAAGAVMVLSKADIYGGKLCAALDRPHPRDLHDVVLDGQRSQRLGYPESFAGGVGPPLDALVALKFDAMMQG